MVGPRGVVSEVPLYPPHIEPETYQALVIDVEACSHELDRLVLVRRVAHPQPPRHLRIQRNMGIQVLVFRV